MTVDLPVLRPAAPTDARPVEALIRRAYAPWIGRLSDLPDVAADIPGELACHRAIVAEAGGTVVGIAISTPGPQHWHLRNLAVDPAHGGRGLGRMLVEETMGAARSAGVTCLQLATHRLMAETRAFYMALGWTETGRDGVRVFLEHRLSDRPSAPLPSPDGSE